ncbi:ribonuclease H protein [Trifolium medium]|uniref:Ribonuclease H protein n=1 Tax=Trifolium medium TaxID=97028 RepID=A0A392MPU0_9FABA|nr:ribonuclease H protein [Trifolium medium]
MSISLRITAEVNGALVSLPFALFAEMKMKQSFMDWIFDNLNKRPGERKNNEWQTIFMKRPREGWVKLNCDGTHKSSVNLSGCGGLLRDSSGVCLTSYAHKLGTCDALHVEMCGMYLSMDLAMRQEITHLQVDSDSKVLVDMVTGNCTINGNIPTLVRRIRDLKNMNWQAPPRDLQRLLFDDISGACMPRSVPLTL